MSTPSLATTIATPGSSNSPARQVPTYDIHEFHHRQTRYAVLIPVLEEGERILNQLRRMEFLRGVGDIIIGDGGSKDTTGDPNVLRTFAVRTLLVKTSAGKQSAQLRMLLDYATDQGYEGFVLIDGNNKDGVDAIPNFFDAMDRGLRLHTGIALRQGRRGTQYPLGPQAGRGPAARSSDQPGCRDSIIPIPPMASAPSHAASSWTRACSSFEMYFRATKCTPTWPCAFRGWVSA